VHGNVASRDWQVLRFERSRLAEVDNGLARRQTDYGKLLVAAEASRLVRGRGKGCKGHRSHLLDLAWYVQLYRSFIKNRIENATAAATHIMGQNEYWGLRSSLVEEITFRAACCADRSLTR
jgi:hypothetical protein